MLLVSKAPTGKPSLNVVKPEGLRVTMEARVEDLERTVDRQSREIHSALDRMTDFMNTISARADADDRAQSERVEYFEKFLGESVEWNVRKLKDLDARVELLTNQVEAAYGILKVPGEGPGGGQHNAIPSNLGQQINYVSMLIDESTDKHEKALRTIDGKLQGMDMKIAVFEAQTQKRLSGVETLVLAGPAEIQTCLTSLQEEHRRCLCTLQDEYSMAKSLLDTTTMTCASQTADSEARFEILSKKVDEFQEGAITSVSDMAERLQREQRARQLQQDSYMEIMAQERCTRENAWKMLEHRLSVFETSVWSILDRPVQIVDVPSNFVGTQSVAIPPPSDAYARNTVVVERQKSQPVIVNPMQCPESGVAKVDMAAVIAGAGRSNQAAISIAARPVERQRSLTLSSTNQLPSSNDVAVRDATKAKVVRGPVEFKSDSRSSPLVGSQHRELSPQQRILRSPESSIAVGCIEVSPVRFGSV